MYFSTAVTFSNSAGLSGSQSIGPCRITDQQKKVEDGVSGRAGQIEGLLKQPGSSDSLRGTSEGELLDCHFSGGVDPRWVETPWVYTTMYAGDVGYVGCCIYLLQAIIFEKGYISFSFLGAKKQQNSQQSITIFRISFFFHVAGV